MTDARPQPTLHPPSARDLATAREIIAANGRGSWPASTHKIVDAIARALAAAREQASAHATDEQLRAAREQGRGEGLREAAQCAKDHAIEFGHGNAGDELGDLVETLEALATASAPVVRTASEERADVVAFLNTCGAGRDPQSLASDIGKYECHLGAAARASERAKGGA